MNEALVAQMVKEFLEIYDTCSGIRFYQDHVIRWVALYHMYDEEFEEALNKIQVEMRMCIPNGKLDMKCYFPCGTCHLKLKQELINRINNPFNERV